ncbi:MAG: D-arabinono-1,4-lactone oxidase [Actinomycetota bacterium]|nr:D-arabinono-1,4-lactone oxidase [Actinomycetota bacterium]
MPEWSNWSGSVRATPVRVEAPRTEAEVQDLVRRAAADGLAVRPAGTRHSFVPLCATDGVAVDLYHLTGVERIDGDVATIAGGTRIADIGETLRAAGLSLHNQGDIDVQTVTGAIGTGTHGTGPTLGNLPSGVCGLRVVTGSGDLVECSPTTEPDLFEAARLSLGALGIITAVSFRCLPAYNLHERIWFEGPDESLAAITERVAATRHYEFFWHPSRDLFEHKTLAVTDAEPDLLPDRKREYVDHSHRVFPSVREAKFNEMEYSIPADAGIACFTEIRALMQECYPDVQWPVEYRTLAADTVWLSPALGRPTVTISIHEDASRPYDALFGDCEAVFRAYDGRPHWGKVHNRTAADLAPTYERWDDFWRTRAAFDPDGRFLNDHLRTVGGL